MGNIEVILVSIFYSFEESAEEFVHYFLPVTITP